MHLRRIVRALFALAVLTACWSLASGAAYVGTWNGALLYVHVDDGPPTAVGAEHPERVFVRVRSEPLPDTRVDAPWLDAAGAITWGAQRAAFHGRAASWSGGQSAVYWPSIPAEANHLDVRLDAAMLPDRVALDPFGDAILTIEREADLEPVEVALEGVGTTFVQRARLADGTLDVRRQAPFFYAEPWSTLDLVGPLLRDAAESVQAGLLQRRDLARSVVGVWTVDQTAHVMSLSADVVSVLEIADAYTGGAHPNTFLTGSTYLRTLEGWQDVGLCDALGALGLPCPEDAIRAHVIDDLAAQEAAWVLDGEVDRDTPWLLDTFTVTSAGIRFDFSPYDVGPYVQGPFLAFVPFTAIAGR